MKFEFGTLRTTKLTSMSENVNPMNTPAMVEMSLKCVSDNM